jgi:maltose 6'-phosphate phosphatase
MDKIKLLYVENVITRKMEVVQQNLSFFIRVENLGYNKKIDVIWAGEDGAWHTLPAIYHSMLGHDQEYWHARMEFDLTPEKSLPGNIQFGLRYQALDEEYWDNNQGLNYSSQADSGIRVVNGAPVQNIGFGSALSDNQRIVPVTVAVDRTLDAEKVVIYWTTDNWKTTHKAPCHFKMDYWDSEMLSNARNPNQYGAQVWKGWLKVDSAFGVQYSICCESKGQTLWDNNFGNNYLIRRKPLKVLILNLHCYQEEDQNHKFSLIAKAIKELNVDIVCFQEVAALWNNGKGDWDTNSARIINDCLDAPYHVVADWAHLGFDKYREGVAILSRYPVVKHKSRYVSKSDDFYNIHSRKVVMAQIKVPYIGLLNVFSSHLSWWDDGFPEQFEKLRRWAGEEQIGQVRGTLLCGDFNIEAGSSGYELVIDTDEYDDQYLAANDPKVFEQIFRGKNACWRRYLEGDRRIDYIFMNKSSELRVVAGTPLFTEQDYGRVSDHCGYLMTFEPK